jgi:hypothetical protein
MVLALGLSVLAWPAADATSIASGPATTGGKPPQNNERHDPQLEYQ